jgi:hypothetical protein
VLATDDIKNAFPSVVIADVMADHARYIQDQSLLALVDVVLRGGEGEKRNRGIDQGNAYSPTALNVRLHHSLDLGMAKGQHPFWHRYADNFVSACRNVLEGSQFLYHVGQLLARAGFTLKSIDGPAQDLRKGGNVQLLGFRLARQDGQISYDLGIDAWVKLNWNLEKAHNTADPALSARQVIDGWILAKGPAFENCRVRTLRRILHNAAQLGFREVYSAEKLADTCSMAYQRWFAFRKKVYRKLESL